MQQYEYTYTVPKASKNLSCALIVLNNWKIVRIEGQDAIQYLQGQLTCDMRTVNENKYTFAAHCNPYGKIINNMYVLCLSSGVILIQRDKTCNKQITAMKKYAIFSNITITIDHNHELFGVAGYDARKKLKNIFYTLPTATHTVTHDHTGTIILHFTLPEERFLLIIPKNNTHNTLKQLINNMEVTNNTQWTSLDIESGYPIITIETSEQLIPQAVNLHILHAISFNKGCYIGQEIIARTKYKNTNHRALYWLIGKDSKKLPNNGKNLEVKIHKHQWKNSGLILKSCQISTGEIWIQAVLPHNIPNDSEFRIITQKDNIFKIYPLPYSI